jgi:hypothetical protein
VRVKMKKIYDALKLEVVPFESNDVIGCSQSDSTLEEQFMYL